MSKISPCLWFNNNLDEALAFYPTVFKNTKINSVEKGPDGKAFVAQFQIEDETFMAINGGPMYQLTEAVSFMVMCDDQEEVDRYWNMLTADGGEESMCGWLKDKFGVSWQITPRVLMQLRSDPDRDKANRVVQAMLKMRKIDIAALEAAANQA